MRYFSVGDDVKVHGKAVNIFWTFHLPSSTDSLLVVFYSRFVRGLKAAI